MNVVRAISAAFGPPRLFWEVWTGSRLDAAVGRWRHQGACADLSGGDSFQIVFNVSGGQRVELRRGALVNGGVMRAGSIGVIAPENAGTVEVSGTADTLQIFLSRSFVEAVRCDGAEGSRPSIYAVSDPQLQAAAIQSLVALAQPCGVGEEQLRRAVRTVARRLASPSPASPARGGLSPQSIRRIDLLVAERLRRAPATLPRVGELAAVCGLSPHHFIRAFRQSLGDTPHAHMATRRLDASLSLLLGNKRVDETAEALGFSSPSHFVSAFRLSMGVTPGALREAAA